MTRTKPAPLASLPTDVLPKVVYLVVRREYEDVTIHRAYLSREAAERNITLGLRKDYIAYLEQHATNVGSLHPDTNPTPISFLDFASRHTDLEIEEVEVIG